MFAFPTWRLCAFAGDIPDIFFAPFASPIVLSLTKDAVKSSSFRKHMPAMRGQFDDGILPHGQVGIAGELGEQRHAIELDFQ